MQSWVHKGLLLISRMVFILVACVVVNPPATAQQVADTSYSPVVDSPSFEAGAGPIVAIDAYHHNFHTKEGRFQAFARVLELDGYRVLSKNEKFTLASLNDIDILVISNALHERNVEDWSLPTPSAFTVDEIDAVQRWVEEGGSLWLIADHMPMPGAAADLAAAFGFSLNNGFAYDTLSLETTIFRRVDNTLRDHPITRGRNASERVDSIRTFTGQAFQAPPSAEPMFVFPASTISLMPEVAWEFDENTQRVSVGGWCQAAVVHHGHGRVAMFGEAAMLTAQWAGGDGGWFGLGSPGAEQNLQLLLNVSHWLSGHLPESQ